jgi:NAD(P)-dependent dehydrogenase (short-subunit alcohol dehydrogenase family)
MNPARDLFDLAQRKALVTGASRGIGLAIARAYVERGAEVVITGRKADTLSATAQELASGGGKVVPVVCHQGDPGAVAALFAKLDATQFVPDIVVINAATNPVFGPLLDVDVAAWQKIVEVNLTGSLVTAQHAARRMMPRRSGSILLMASVAGLEPMPGLGAYSVSKTALLGLTKALATELGPHGIRVNALAPGLIETRFSAALFQDPGTYQQIMKDVPLGRHGQPQDLVGAALFLASDASAYMTGQVVVVDGGMRMQ